MFNGNLGRAQVYLSYYWVQEIATSRFLNRAANMLPARISKPVGGWLRARGFVTGPVNQARFDTVEWVSNPEHAADR